MQFEVYADKYNHIAEQYEKILYSLEMANSKIIFILDETEKNKFILDKLEDFEIRINEIKSTYNVIIPTVVANLFPIIHNINIFSLIKKLELHKRYLIHKFKNIKNEIQYILFKWKKNDTNNIEQQKEKNRLLFLYDVKNKIKNELNEHKNAYDIINEIFIKEIHYANYFKNYTFLSYFIAKKLLFENKNYSNVEKYLKPFI